MAHGLVSLVLSLLLVPLAACKASPDAPPSAAPATAPTVVPEARTSDVAGVTFLDTAPSDALTLDVRVRQHHCEITDPDGVYDEELHFPLGRAVRLNLHSGHSGDPLKDGYVALEHKLVHVLHGSVSQLVFRVDHQGNYAWQCWTVEGPSGNAPISPSSIYAHSPRDYVAYQRRQNEQTRPTTREGRIRLGKSVYEKAGCVACHTDDGSPRVGISFAGLWGKRVTLVDGSTRVVDERFIKDSIVNPRANRQVGYGDSMPVFGDLLRAEDIAALAAYIESLGTL